LFNTVPEGPNHLLSSLTNLECQGNPDLLAATTEKVLGSEVEQSAGFLKGQQASTGRIDR
jgi:hypothetical protein